MQPDFWHERWRKGQTAFHQTAVDRHLAQHWATLQVPAGGRVFVPLCGKSLDLLWLRTHGHSVVGVELSALALESLCMENGIPAKRRQVDDFEVYEAEGLELYCGDFFALTPALLGSVSAVYDRAALIAWPPEMRADYVAHISALTASGTQTLLITLEYPQSQMSGPPFSVTADEVRRLYARDHAIQQLSRDDILAAEPRLRSRGLNELHEISFRLTRL